MSRILVVESNLRYQKMLVQALGFAGHDAVAVSNTDDALAYLQGTMVDLLLVNLNIPGKDTVEFLKNVRNEVPFGILPIIVMTETTDQSGLLLASQLGIQEVIPRPKVPLGRILGYVRQHLHRAVSNEGTLVAWA